jgi:ribonuclease P protein component
LIGRISARREFEQLTRHGRRARTATLWCRYVDDPGAAPLRVAFAIGRTVGSAVTRNRLRRRLRELVRRAVTADPPLLTSGRLLIGAQPGAGELPFERLAGEVDTLLRALRPSGPVPT